VAFQFSTSNSTSMMNILVKGPTASKLVLVLGRGSAPKVEAEEALLNSSFVFT
jgi:hypothetical protein